MKIFKEYADSLNHLLDITLHIKINCPSFASCVIQRPSRNFDILI